MFGFKISSGAELQLETYLAQSVEKIQSVVLCGPKGLGKASVAFPLCERLLGYRGLGDLMDHPDFLYIRPEGASIKKEQLDSMEQFIQIRAGLAPRRVVLVDDADRMSVDCQNSLLKMVEEGMALFVFVAHRDLLNTIMSRCVVVPFHPLEKNEMMEAIKEPDGVLLTLAGGKIGAYYSFCQNPEYLNLIRDMICVLGGNDARELLTFFHLLREKDPENVYDRLSGEELDGVLEVLISIFESAYLSKIGCGKPVFVGGSSFVMALGADDCLEITNKLREGIVLNRRKGRYSMNDFIELVFLIVLKGRGCLA